MPTYSPQRTDGSGASLTFNPAANGDKVPPGCTLIIRNTSGSPITPTVVTQGVVDGDLAIADRALTAVPATTGFVGYKVPNTDAYRDPADGLVTLNWSATTNVSYAVIS